jgi:thymidylate synthase ThyX
MQKLPYIGLGITDHFPPDIQAMLIARYSRNYGPILERLPKSDEDEASLRAGLRTNYVNYGHKSVSQLGVTTVWFEDVSQLAAKALENHPLFNGQEPSTRYINFSTQSMINFKNSHIEKWQETYRAFYLKALPLVIEKLKLDFPFENNRSEYHEKTLISQQDTKQLEVWNKTIKARAFDICRGILPAGVVTNVAFQATFDTINDHFSEMLFHPSQEIKDIALSTLNSLQIKYPDASFDIQKHIDRNKYIENKTEYFYQIDPVYNYKEIPSLLYVNKPNSLDINLNRQKFEKYPKSISSQYKMDYSDVIDFGSYRDIHRHRNGSITMPLLTPTLGFNEFYLNNLTPELKKELEDINDSYLIWYNASDLSAVMKQYSTPMGFNVTFRYTCDLNQTLYILELRSSKTVHQTLRKVCHRWAKAMYSIPIFNDKDQKNIFIGIDWDEDNFTLKRGTQDFSSTDIHEAF